MPRLPGVLLALAMLAPALPVHAHSPTQEPAVQARAASPSASPRARELTLALVDLASQHAAAAPGNGKGRLLAELIAVAKARHDELIVLAAVDPAEFARVALPAQLRAPLPPQALPFLEQDADESGTLDVFHVDHVNTADDYYEHVLTTAKGVYRLHFASEMPTLGSGATVRARGLKVGHDIVLARGGDLMVVNAVSVLPNALGAQKTLVILVNFSDAPTAQPYTVAQATNVVFNTTSNYDYEVSYQQTTLTGTVAGWYTIANPSTNCDYSTIASQAKQKASAAGYVLSNYNRYVYVFPANTCSWWGLGSVGGNPSQAWIHAKHGLTLGVVGHEMGHNFGLWHSHSLDCGSNVVAASGCSASEYGDVFDIMGNSSTAHFNAYHKERLGWLNAGVSPPLTTVPAQAGTRTYGIGALESPRDTTPRALKIPRGASCSGTNEWFYVESRKGQGFDSIFASNASVVNGVIIHRVTEGQADSSYLLDMTPATSSWADAPLVVGQSFVDPLTGLTISPASVSASGATINVTFPTSSCTPAAPTMTFTPAGTIWTTAGAAITYNITVTNKDSCGCAASAYDLGATVPSSWGATLSRTASVSPGGSTTGSVVVSSPVAAAEDFYPVAVKATHTAATSLVAAGNATVAVAKGVAVTATSDKASYTLPKQKNTAVNALITTRVTSLGTNVSGAAVTVVVRDPSNKSVTLNSVTASDGTARVTYSMRARNSPLGTYTVTSTARVGSITGGAGTTFTAVNQ